jgi:LysR family hydrogen peroxide-inducible transcriptional activator
MKLPALRQMQYLVSLHEHLHFGRAASACFISQPTLSSAIRELEETLGASLVERTNRTVAFTSAGTTVVEQCEQILLQTREMVDSVQQYRVPLTGSLKLGVIPTIAPFLMPGFVARIRRKYPQLELYIRENTTQLLISELISGKLDLLVLALPYHAPQTFAKKVFREKLHLAYHRENKLLKANRIDFNQLPDGSLLLLEDGHCLRDHALAGCRISNNHTIHTFGVTSLQMLVQMVNRSIGVTLLPQMAIDSGILSNTDVLTQPLPISRYYRDIGMAWRKASAKADEYELLSLELGTP